jgi:hypothetical protein
MGRAFPDYGPAVARFALRRRPTLVVNELSKRLPVGSFDYDSGPAYFSAPIHKVAVVRAIADVGRNELVAQNRGLILS